MPLLGGLEGLGVEVESMALEDLGDRRRIALELELPSDRPPADVLDRLGMLEGVHEMRWSR